MELLDLKETSTFLSVQAREGAGRSMFKMSAATFAALEKSVQGDMVEKWCGVPVYGHFILELNTDTIEVSIFPFKLQLLPAEFMVCNGDDVVTGADDEADAE